MRKNHVLTRLLSVFLVLCMVAAWVLPSAAHAAGIQFTQVSNDRVSANLFGKDAVNLKNDEPGYAPNDVVRVSIFLNKAGVIDAGYSVQGLAQNEAAMAYREKLAKDQTSVVAKIEKATKEKLDVVWNLTLATNLISANVKYGQIEAIKAIGGVDSVVIVTPYEPDVVESAVADPNMATSAVQTGTHVSYAEGYTGAGSRIAIIDTGLDIEHQSFNASAFAYSLSNLAGKAGMSPEAYIESLDLLDAEEIASVLAELNVAKKANVTAEDIYINSKVPFGFNYIDANTNVIHLNDGQGEHGSHVAGIATANSYIANADGTFSNALDTVHVQGVAPDAQIIVMKVFGANGGAYPDDYMAAIEDAILLGADSVNLSLGSGAPGMSTDATAKYQAIMDSLEKCGVVVAMSAGNSFAWMEASENGVPYMYLDDVSMQTNGSPGSYTNSLAVASVDNAGYDAAYLPAIVVDGKGIGYYESNEYGNVPFATLVGESEYVFLNGVGTPEEFAALGEGALEGKIAICYRGETSFFEKANAAVAAGAIGVVIVNNQSGVIYLNLTGYNYTAPVVSVTLADGEVLKTNAVTDEAGNVLCWTGKLSINSEGLNYYASEYYTMSSFSSWGVPGSLILKPEITAPGGNILSVAGAHVTSQTAIYDHVTYEVMSGTSMAAPQVTGMAALVAQYIRENDLTTKTGLDARTLAQSLLMSTSVPVLEGENGGYYYSILKQGSGLANVGAAVAADSYILMNADATASYADGKVKVELGDDPNKTGVYNFSFTINNLTDEDDTYALYADFFTQGAFAAYDGIGQVKLYMDTMTSPLTPAVVFTIDGKEIEGGVEMFGMDFNGDGKVNSADGQLLLDYATGVATEIANAAAADIDGDGNVNSNDAYLFFKMLGESGAVVPANGSVNVEVTVTLSNSDRAWLANYENGAYLEGFVYAQCVADAEGVEGTCHSIPVLGFYGNWSDPSMFDQLSYEDLLTGDVTLPYLYESAFAKNNMNGLLINYASDPTTHYYFGGNPIVDDDVYMPERNAISGVNGDKISKIGFTSIRNAAASYYQVYDHTNDQYLINQSVGAVSSAYYYVNGSQWKNTYLSLTTNQSFKGIADNTLVEMGITLIPEYYVDRNGNVDWDALGDGVSLSMEFTVDNTAPVLNDVAISLMNNTMTVDVTDNQYIAAVALLNYAGTQAFILEGSQADAVPGEACEYVLDLEGISGKGFLLAVYDYAMNCTVYEINTQIGEVVDTPEQVVLSKTSMVMVKDETAKLTATVYPTNISDASVVWSSTNNNVVTVSSDGTVTAVGAGRAQIVAASKLDPDVKAVCNVQVIDVAVDMNAIIWDEQGSIWYSSFNTATLPEYKKLGNDLLEVDYISSACSAPDGTIYACSMDPDTMEGAMYVIDPVTYEATKLTDCIVQGLHVFYADLTYAPNFFGTGEDALLAIYGPYVIVLDPDTGEYISIIDQYDTDLVGIATCYGYYDEENDQSTVCTYVIGSDGTLYQELYCYLPAYGMALPFYYYMYEMRMAFSTGIDVGGTWFWNSLAYSAEKAMVFWSKFDYDNDNEVTLYAIDEMNDFAVYNLGDFGDTVWPVGGLHQSVPSYASAYSAVNTSELQAALKREIVAEEHKIERINVVKESLPTAEVTKNSIEIADKEESITVTVTAPEDTTNGVITVEYDSDALVLKNVVVNGDYISVLEEDGTVTFGYVAMNGIAAEEALATLVFDVLDTDASGVTVTYKEINDTTPDTSADLDVEFPHANTEIRDAKDADCVNDGYTGDTYCVDCGKLIAKGEVIEASGHTYEAVVTPPTCTDKGYTTYTCACGDTYVDDEVAATGHSFGEWEETKAPSCTEPGTETRECACGETEEREIAATGHSHEAVVTPPTCTDKGYTTYTCACGDTYVADEVAATGHKYNSVVTAPTTDAEGYTTHTCEHCGDSYVDSYTEKLPVPDPDNGKTGDEFMAHLWIMALLSSAAALAVLVIYGKKFYKA